jgi:uncharacterized membrane protein YebE (DUF533 family)
MDTPTILFPYTQGPSMFMGSRAGEAILGITKEAINQFTCKLERKAKSRELTHMISPVLGIGALALLAYKAYECYANERHG